MEDILALDIGGTFIKHAIISGEGEIEKKDKTKTPKALNELLNLIEELAEKHSKTAGIAVSSPGAVSDVGIIYGSSALPYLHGPNIKELIMERTKMPVYIENDANCAGYAEVWKGAAQGKKDVLVITIGTGIGGAVIKEGELHKGANLHGGEFGYMLMNSELKNGDNTWSKVGSTVALVKKVAEVKQLKKDYLTGEEIFNRAEAGDEDCIYAIDQFYHLLAVGIYNLQYVFDPEVILIGGGISARKDLVKGINEKLDIIIDAVALAKIKPLINSCQFRQDANLLGAVYGFIKEKNQ